MKQLFSSVAGKLRRKRKIVPPPARITAETVDHHRAHILNQGSKYKYQFQYTKHKLVFNAIIIAIFSIILIGAVVWQQLYIAQNTGDISYRITKLLPLKVAEIDGQAVPYSDYLFIYRSTIHYLENIKNKGNDVGATNIIDEQQRKIYKEKALQSAIEEAFAKKLSVGLNLEIKKTEIDEVLRQQRLLASGEVSEKSYNAALLENYGIDLSDWCEKIERVLLKQKVAYKIDKVATQAAADLGASLASDKSKSFSSLATELGKKYNIKVESGDSSWVPKQNQDGGMASTAGKLEKGALSSVGQLMTSDGQGGFFVVKLKDSNDSQVNYSFIKIPLTEFYNRINNLDKSGKIRRYIKL